MSHAYSHKPHHNHSDRPSHRGRGSRAGILALLLALVSGLIAATSTPAAVAAGAELPRLTSPAPDEVVNPAWSTISLETSHMAFGANFMAWLKCQSGEHALGPVSSDGWGNDFDFPENLPLGQRCEVGVVDDAGTYSPLGTFSLEKLMSGPRQSHDELWSRVRDGYRDSVRVGWTSAAESASYTATVMNAAGRTVRTARLGSLDEFETTWTWRGVSDSGKPVATGAYRITVTGGQGGYPGSSLSWRVRVKSGVVTLRGVAVQPGDWGTRATRGNCTATRYSYDESTMLDCWGGRYARVTYGFRLPRNTTAVSWRVRGGKGVVDICCRGKITKSAKRVSKTRLRVTAQVTGWRSYEVGEVVVNYRYRARR